MKRILLQLLIFCFVCIGLYAQNEDTPNLSFELGRFDNWELYTGSFTFISSDSTFKYNLWSKVSTSSSRFVIGSNNNDPIVACDLKNSPLNKNAARIGEPFKRELSGGVNTAAERMIYRFKVTENSTLLSYKLSTVLKTPTGDTHGGDMQPSFSLDIILKDALGFTTYLPCSNYTTIADFLNPQLIRNKTKIQCPSTKAQLDKEAEQYTYQPWYSGNLNLNANIGDSVIIIITNKDCLVNYAKPPALDIRAGTHESYGYFWAETKKNELTSSSCEDSEALLIAPKGFDNYKWERSDGYLIPINNDTLIVDKTLNFDNVTYTCEMSDANNSCGSIKVSKTISQAHLFPDFTSSAIEAGKIQFTSTSTVLNDTISSYYWDFGDGTTSNQKDPIHEYTQYNNFDVKLTIRTKQGCSKYKIYSVLPTKELIATLTPNDSLQYNGQTKDCLAKLNVTGLQLNFHYFIRYKNQVGTPFYNGYSAPSAVGKYTATFELSFQSLLKYFMKSVPSIDFEITKAPLQITVNNVTKIYGQTISLASDGFTQNMKPLYAGDKINTLELSCDGLNDTSTVKTYDIIPTLAKGDGVGNYAISFVKGILTVQPKPLAVKAVNASKVYGTLITPTGKEFSIAAGSFVDKDTVLSVAVHCAGHMSSASYGNYPITIDGATGRRLGNYTLTYAPAELVVEKKKITVTANNLSKVYGTDYSFTGKEYTTDKNQFVGTDSIATVQLFSAATPQKVAVGDYGLTITDVLGSGIDNYDMKWVNATFKVTPMPIVITANSKIKEYGDIQAFSGNEFSTNKPLVTGDTISFVMLKSSGSVETAPIGHYQIFASQAYGIGTLNYDFSYVSGQLNVLKKKVVAGIFPPSYLVYNALNKDFTVTVNVSGLVQNVDYFIRYTSKDGLYSSTTAPVGAGDYTATFELSAAAMNNYELTNAVSTDFTIAKAPLTITPESSQKTYGENLTLYKNAFKTDIKPLYGSDRIDELELSCNGLKDTASVGTYPIIATKAIGFGVDNYAIHFDEGSLMVHPKQLTIAAINSTKTYGDQVNVTGKEFYIVPGSLVGTDKVDAVQLQCGGYDALSIIGNYNIELSAAAGARLTNYVINYTKALLTVEKKKITVTAKQLAKTYGNDYTFSGKEFETDKSLLVGVDSIAEVQLLSSATAKKAPVGEYSLSVTGISGYRLDNYEIKLQNNTYKVHPMPITIIANNKVKEYGDLLTFTGNEFTTNIPLVAGDTISFVLMKSAGSIQSSPINNYDILISLAYGAGTMNYDFTYVPGMLTVIKKDITASIFPPAYLGYNAKPKDFTATTNVSGLLLNDDYFIRYINKSGTPTYNSVVAPFTAGEYTATFELSSPSLLKYNLANTPTQDFTITKAPLTVTVDDVVKTYGDKANLVRDAFKTDIKPLFGSDRIFELELSSAGVSDTASVGTFAIVPSKAIGQGVDNYEFKFVDGTLTVKPKMLQIKALDVAKTYGEKLISTGEAFYVDAHSLVGNDTVWSVDLQSVGYTTNATVGTYPITSSKALGRRLNNYNISYLDASLSVNKRKITVAAQPISKLYGAQFMFSGNEYTTDTLQLVGTDKISSVQLSSQGASKQSSVGDYSINITGISGTGLSNYDITQLNSTLKVTPMAIRITANNMNKSYGTLLTFNGNEFVTDKPLLNGDTISFVSIKSSGSVDTAPVGDYDVLASQAYGIGTMNYDFTYQTGKLSVVRKNISATITAPSYLVYNALNKDFTASFDVVGLIQNTDYYIRYTSKDGTYNSFVAPINVGEYTATLELSSLSSLKYSMSTTPTKDFRISKAPLVLTAENTQKTYGETLQLLNDAFRLDMSPLFGSDAVFMVDFDCTGLVDTASVKTYFILPKNAKGSGVDNYDIKYIAGTLTVNPKPLLIKANNVSKVYGDFMFPNSKNFYVDSRELVGTDIVKSVSLACDGYATLATTGFYPIKPYDAIGARMKNYQISYADGSLQVMKKKISVLAQPIYKEYGSEYIFRGTEFTSAASQFVGSDKVTGVKLNSQGAQSKASVGEYGLAISDVVGNGIDNYDITYQNSVLFVTPKPIVVIGNDLEKEFGDVLTFSGNEFSTDIPLLNNDTISFTFLKSAGTAATAPVGVYDIIPAQASGAGSLNYSISYRPARLTVVQKQLQVTAKNLIKEYGEAEPDKSFTVTDKRGVAYQPSMFTGKLSREQGEKVGVYKITKGNLSVAPSYNYSFTEGELAIVKALPSIDPVFSNNAGEAIVADVIGSKNGDFPQGKLNVRIIDAGIDNTSPVIDGSCKTSVSALPDHMVQVELNYLGDDNYLPTSTKMNVYAIVYHCNGGKVLAPITHFDGNEAVKIENPTHDDNYKFEGWYESPDFSGVAIRRVPVATYHDVDLYARWTVTYDDLSIVVLFNQVLAVANPLNHEFLYNSTYKWFKDGVQLEGNKQYCGFENFVPSGNYKVEIYYMSNPAIILELAHSSSMQKTKLYPNPLKRNAQLTLNSEFAKDKDVSIEVYTVTGARLKTITVEKEGDMFKLNGFNHSGVYMVRIVQNGSVKETHKVIVEE